MWFVFGSLLIVLSMTITIGKLSMKAGLSSYLLGGNVEKIKGFKVFPKN